MKVTNRLLSLVIVIGLVVGPACNLFDDDDDGSDTVRVPLTFEDVPMAANLAVPAPGTVVLRDEAAFNEFWADHHDSPLPIIPVIDFSQQMVLVVFWGQGFSGCSSHVDVVAGVFMRVKSTGRPTVIEVQVRPLPDLGDCAALVNPIQMVTIEASPLPVEFVGAVPR